MRLGLALALLTLYYVGESMPRTMGIYIRNEYNYKPFGILNSLCQSDYFRLSTNKTNIHLVEGAI